MSTLRLGTNSRWSSTSSHKFNSLVKLFADNTSLFSTVHDPTLSAKILNDDLSRISEWARRWKMLFNPDISNQAQEVIFSRKNTKNDHPIVHFNGALVAHTTCQKYLGINAFR